MWWIEIGNGQLKWQWNYAEKGEYYWGEYIDLKLRSDFKKKSFCYRGIILDFEEKFLIIQYVLNLN